MSVNFIVLLIFALNVRESLRTKKLCVVDNAWTLSFIVQAVLYFVFYGKTDGNWDIYKFVGSLLVIVANTRLFFHLKKRNYGLKGDDPRFVAIREKLKVEDTFWSIFIKVYLVQYLLSIMIGRTIFEMNSGSNSSLPLFILGVITWGVGFYMESSADSELRAHIAAGKTTILDTGVWKYSRHPNYFGEFAMWVGISLIAFGISESIFSFSAPLVIYYILNYVSGVPMSEKRWDESNKPGWAEYKARTPKFFPFMKP